MDKPLINPSGPAPEKELRRMSSMAKEGATMAFRDISYSVTLRKGPCACFREKIEKQILRRVSGIFSPGMNAIMGPTGCGKSSLLDVLAGRKDPAGLSGSVLVDGQDRPHNFQYMSGYVTQDDVIMGTLTVRENLLFSANMRLPPSVTHAQKLARVEQVLEELGLTHCADTKVGTELIRGVSGGERKRTNIGMELITAPRVLFLDEPTTGLDAHTAHSVMELLHRLAQRGQTMVFSIHQPRYSIFKLFDSLALLCKGRMVFHGPASEVLPHFSKIGFQCEEHNNPPDFFLDVLSGTMGSAMTGQVQVESLDSSGTSSDDELLLEAEAGDDILRDSLPRQLAMHYEASDYYNATMMELNNNFTASGKLVDKRKRKMEHATPFHTQLWLLSKRATTNLIRNPAATVLQMGVMVVVSLIVGILFLRIDDSKSTGIQNRAGAFFFIVMNMIFGNLSSVEPFIKQRTLFKHERSNGFYRTSAYFLSKVFCDIIPNRIIPVLLYCCISYWMVGLDADVNKFFIYVLTLLLTSVAGTSVCFAVSSGCTVFAIANLGVTLIYVIMMIFNGMLRNLTDMPAWCRWLKYLSIFRYSMEALQINEMKDQKYCDAPSNTSSLPPQCDRGNDYLESQGIAHDSIWDLWRTQVALVGITIGFMLIAYIQLRKVKRYT